MKTNQVIADFRVERRTEMDEKLDAAVEAARIEASVAGAGVLVTRHDFFRFSVSLSSDVPFGVTIEHDLAFRN